MSSSCRPGVAPGDPSALVLAQQPGNDDNGGQGEDFGKSSPVGLLVLILFLVAVVFLVRSMTKHLKRVPESFDNDDAEGRGPRRARRRPSPPRETETETRQGRGQDAEATKPSSCLHAQSRGSTGSDSRREHGEHAFVHPPQRLAARDPLQRLQAERVLAQRERRLRPSPACAAAPGSPRCSRGRR